MHTNSYYAEKGNVSSLATQIAGGGQEVNNGVMIEDGQHELLSKSTVGELVPLRAIGAPQPVTYGSFTTPSAIEMESRGMSQIYTQPCTVTSQSPFLMSPVSTVYAPTLTESTSFTQNVGWRARIKSHLPRHHYVGGHRDTYVFPPEQIVVASPDPCEHPLTRNHSSVYESLSPKQKKQKPQQQQQQQQQQQPQKLLSNATTTATVHVYYPAAPANSHICFVKSAGNPQPKT